MSEHETFTYSFSNPPDPDLGDGWDDADTINPPIFCPNPELGTFKLCELRDEVERNPKKDINACLTQVDHDTIRQSQEEQNDDVFSSKEYIEDINQCFSDEQSE